VDRLEALGRYGYLATIGESQRLLWEEPRDAAGIRAFLADPGPKSGDVFAVLG
jgi:hypothetical protein